jgi:hypothetical protein
MDWSNYWHYVMWAALFLVPAVMAIGGGITVAVAADNEGEPGAERMFVWGAVIGVIGAVFLLGVFSASMPAAKPSPTTTPAIESAGTK